MEHFIFTNNENAEVKLLALNLTTGQSHVVTFAKIGKCLDYCRQNKISIPMSHCSNLD